MFKIILNKFKKQFYKKPPFIKSLEAGQISLCYSNLSTKAVAESPNALLDGVPVCVYKLGKDQNGKAIGYYYSNARPGLVAHTFSKDIRKIEPLG